MTRAPAVRARHDIQSLFHHGVATGLTDQELMERFATCRDEAGELAFATLVARHGPMVLNVCRRVLGNSPAVDDAFQATFLILVRRAPSLCFASSLGPWLYGVSVRVARRARIVGARRWFVELDGDLADRLPDPAAALDQDLQQAIDEAVARLPANYRAAIVLCHLQGLTHEEAALRLRCPIGTVRSRLARGRALLKIRLERAGLKPSASVAATLAALRPATGRLLVKSPLFDATTRTAQRLAAGQPLAEIVPARISELIIGVGKPMTIPKLVLSVSLLVFTGLGVWGAAGFGAHAGGSTEPRSIPAATGEAPILAFAAINAPGDPAEESGGTEGAAQQAELAIPDDLPPVVVAVEPKLGATDVDPGVKEIRVTFSKKMTDGSWSWTEGTKYATPKLDGKIHYEADERTCVMPVTLEPGKTYVLGINSERFRNFKDQNERPALPYLVVFRTKAAG
jgi:RNA polymerase sigma-70 factor (ECF subfamily)